ncbi:MAG: hypothetical protein CVU99_03375 [Firmicutes bacterium HGW-Firmicutes-4]|jgi:hypothetical protein|nr:MAG: hypothetical protein CVU99_03375 [Firmicutes bacterium HGW-Firmicutes-4]
MDKDKMIMHTNQNELHISARSNKAFEELLEQAIVQMQQLKNTIEKLENYDFEIKIGMESNKPNLNRR